VVLFCCVLIVRISYINISYDIRLFITKYIIYDYRTRSYWDRNVIYVCTQAKAGREKNVMHEKYCCFITMDN
jgi:hypothetical protein